jgi:hypothetical protein
MKKTLFYTLITFIFFTSCRKKEDAVEINAFGFTTFEEAEKQLGKYAKAFYPVNGSIYTRVEQHENADASGSNLFAYAGAWFKSANGLPHSDGGTFFIDDLEMYYDGTDQNYKVKGDESNGAGAEISTAVKAMYGKLVSAKLIRNNQEIFKTTYYTPNLLDLSTNCEKIKQTSFNKISEENGITMKWKKDEKNLNGVVISIVWIGDKLDIPLDMQGTVGQKSFSTKVNDTGECTLPYDFFNKLPDNAIFYLSVIRGNIEIINGTDKKEYKVYNQVESKLTCALVK